LDNRRNNVIKIMTRMTQQGVAELRGDSIICPVGTTLKAQRYDEVSSPLGVDELDAEGLILSFACKCPSIMNRMCEAITLRLSNLLV
jgi:hypothetical protein